MGRVFRESRKPAAGLPPDRLRVRRPGGGDYVRERDAILPDWDADTLVTKALRTD